MPYLSHLNTSYESYNEQYITVDIGYTTTVLSTSLDFVYYYLI